MVQDISSKVSGCSVGQEIPCFYGSRHFILYSQKPALPLRSKYTPQQLVLKRVTMYVLSLEWETRLYIQMKQQALYNDFLKVYDDGWLVMGLTY
jgi:hypothetical protein